MSPSTASTPISPPPGWAQRSLCLITKSPRGPAACNWGCFQVRGVRFPLPSCHITRRGFPVAKGEEMHCAFACLAKRSRMPFVPCLTPVTPCVPSHSSVGVVRGREGQRVTTAV